MFMCYKGHKIINKIYFIYYNINRGLFKIL